MNARFGRFAIGAFAVLGFVAATAGSAFAQTPTPRSLMAGVKFEAASAATTSAFKVTTSRPSYRRQQNTSNDDGGVGFGVLAGITRNTLSSDDLEDFFKANTGTMLGVWVGGNKNGTVGFTGEFIYLIRKSDTDEGKFSYPALEIPAVFHINFGPEDRNKGLGYVIVGPVFTINLKQKLDDVDISEDFNGADIGLIAGGGFEILRFAVEVRGNWGFRSISDEGDVGDIKTRSIEFLVKFRIN